MVVADHGDRMILGTFAYSRPTDLRKTEMHRDHGADRDAVAVVLTLFASRVERSSLVRRAFDHLCSVVVERLGRQTPRGTRRILRPPASMVLSQRRRRRGYSAVNPCLGI
jgi:hypothetical protein